MSWQQTKAPPYTSKYKRIHEYQNSDNQSIRPPQLIQKRKNGQQNNFFDERSIGQQIVVYHEERDFSNNGSNSDHVCQGRIKTFTRIENQFTMSKTKPSENSQNNKNGVVYFSAKQ